MMMKTCLLLALTLVASVSALQDSAPNGGEAAPEPYAYAYQTDSHAASEQRDQQGRVTGFYTLVDADGRERRVEYVADEAGFRAKVQTNEVGTKAESPADVEMVAAEPSPAQLSQAAAGYQQSAQYTAGTQYNAGAQYNAAAPAAAAAVGQNGQYFRSQTYQVAPQTTGYASRLGYQQQYAYGARPYGYSGYYGAAGAYPAGYGGYGGYGNYERYYNVPTGGYYLSPAGYNAAGPTGQYYSYRSTSNAAAPVVAGQYYSYRSSGVAPVPVTTGVTSSYRQVSGTVPASVSSYSAGLPIGGFSAGIGSDGVNAGLSGGSSSSRSASYQGSSNYVVLKKRDADKPASSS